MTYTQPLLLLFGAIAVIGLIRARHSKGIWPAALGVGGLLLVSWPPCDWLLSRPLEMWYPVRPYQPGNAQAIVVLSSAVEPPHYERPYPLPDAESFRRCESTLWIHKVQPSLPILVCGGLEDPAGPPSAVFMKEYLQRAGVPGDMIWTEGRSHNTHEDAVYGAEILRRFSITRIALVVDAASMPRASLCFRKLGLSVIASPSSLRQWGPLREELLPGWKAIYRNEETLHETVGLAWYRLRGWI